MKFPALDILVEPQLGGFFDSTSNTISYFVKDPASRACAIVDSVLVIFTANSIVDGVKINIVQQSAKV